MLSTNISFLFYDYFSDVVVLFQSSNVQRYIEINLEDLNENSAVVTTNSMRKTSDSKFAINQ